VEWVIHDAYYEIWKRLSIDHYKIYRTISNASKRMGVRYLRCPDYYVFLKGTDPGSQRLLADHQELTRHIIAHPDMHRKKKAPPVVHAAQEFHDRTRRIPGVDIRSYKCSMIFL
jgi:hypothetical protein